MSPDRPIPIHPKTFLDLSQIEVTADDAVENPDIFYINLIRVAVSKSYKPGWVSFTYKNKYKRWPKPAWLVQRDMIALMAKNNKETYSETVGYPQK